jgi:integrase
MMSYNKHAYLERHGDQWRVVVNVPRSLHKKLGTKLKKGLGTSSITVANLLKDKVVLDLKERIRWEQFGDSKDPVVKEAMKLREALEMALTPAHREAIREGIVDDAREILGDPLEQRPDRITGDYVYDPVREEKADLFYKIAIGQATPLEAPLADHLSQVLHKERTKGDLVRALRYLADWARANRIPPAIEQITRRVAGRFVADLPKVAASVSSTGSPITPRTVTKYVSSLSGYWKWLKVKGYVEENVWTGQSPPKAQRPAGQNERPFTDEEVQRLLAGSPRPALGAIIRIAALSGARIDAIVSLKVSDCRDGLFRFKPQKKERKERLVPIHSSLQPLIEALTCDKGPADDLFPEYPPPRPGAQQERSMPAVKAFGYYRKSIGVDEQVPGVKRSLVNFHSFRRWFITKAEQAGQPEHIIAAVVGHKREGMTLGLYSGGPSLDQFRACVEAVRLPEVAISPSSA